MTIVAYIPARGGSKRIPKKNIRHFDGIPALGRVIRTVTDTKLCDRIIVSTDNEEIEEVARNFGAEVLQRDATLAGDHAGLLEVVQGDIGHLLKTSETSLILACVLPTAVLLSAEDLGRAITWVREGTARFVVSVGRFSYPVQRALRMNFNSSVEMVWPENYPKRSQDLEILFHDAGQFYVGSTAEWSHRDTMFQDPAKAIIIEDWRVQDIDVEEDWILAEQMWRAYFADRDRS
jgi:pseudaminic acid cytidylyltransferase